MKTNELLTRAELAVKLVEDRLTYLESLNTKTAELADVLVQLNNDEADLLASDKPEKSKVKLLIELRATIDVKQADHAKLKTEIYDVTTESITAGNKVNLWLGALSDALITARTKRVTDQLEEIFLRAAMFEVRRFVGYSKVVQEVSSLDSLHLPTDRKNAVAICRKLRPAFNKLSGAANTESADLEVIAGDW